MGAVEYGDRPVRVRGGMRPQGIRHRPPGRRGAFPRGTAGEGAIGVRCGRAHGATLHGRGSREAMWLGCCAHHRTAVANASAIRSTGSSGGGTDEQEK